MRILGIETSCDETAAAIVKDGTTILSNVTLSSVREQEQYGGVVPEVAARRQVEYIIPVIEQAMENHSMEEIDAIAVTTTGSGLFNTLLVGTETAKVLSYVWNKPLLPAHHIVGHLYSAWLTENSESPRLPALALTVSGGHTELILMEDHSEFVRLGGTRDDAAGEAYDKVARLIGFSHPGGPKIEKLALKGDPNAYNLPRPMINQNNYDYSFSGLKTAVLQLLKSFNDNQALNKFRLSERQLADVAASFQQAAIDSLISKVLSALEEYSVESVLLTGGVSANQSLRDNLEQKLKRFPDVKFLCPPTHLAMDNATHIASAGFFNFERWSLNPDINTAREKIFNLKPNPNLTVEEHTKF